MKKLLILTNLLTLIILYFNACTRTTSNDAGILNNSNVLLSDYSNSPFKGLSPSLVKDVVKNYKNQHYDMYQPTTGQLDARSVWFNLDTLKKFLWNVEVNSKKNTTLDLSKLGIRIYFARYPQASNYPNYRDMANVSTAYENMHTVFMVPTYYNPSRNADVEYDPKYTANKIPEPYADLLKDQTKSLTVIGGLAKIVSGSTQNATAQNHGSLIPPMPPGDYEGADLMEFADTN